MKRVRAPGAASRPQTARFYKESSNVADETTANSPGSDLAFHNAIHMQPPKNPDSGRGGPFFLWDRQTPTAIYHDTPLTPIRYRKRTALPTEQSEIYWRIYPPLLTPRTLDNTTSHATFYGQLQNDQTNEISCLLTSNSKYPHLARTSCVSKSVDRNHIFLKPKMGGEIVRLLDYSPAGDWTGFKAPSHPHNEIPRMPFAGVGGR
ncbi:unnamed protein product, partial [Taenia asiatica]|uniref:SUN domain-containing protein n=1 Tax=Taenia asiatica TaxID=60517 RepID=A0A0R3WGY4_TAEAS